MCLGVRTKGNWSTNAQTGDERTHRRARRAMKFGFGHLTYLTEIRATTECAHADLQVSRTVQNR